MNRPDIAVMPTLAESRARLLGALGAAPSMVFVRPYGNIGDEMIWAGARELLAGHIHREVSVDEISRERGELAVISGGGAWSRAYSEYMPEVLEIAEQRFERVVVFPSTFDTSVARVRAALQATRAVVFARELESYESIRELCDAQLAHDTAFFCPLPEPAVPGEGTLQAFRSDRERNPAVAAPVGNDDISATTESLDAWLAAIAGHAEVRTDRAHVMIAAARLGKPVRYAPGNYFKVRAIAESCLADADVTPLPEAPAEAEVSPAVPAGFSFRPAEGQRAQPGAIEALAAALEAAPQALAAAPALVDRSGAVVSCGGWPVLGDRELAIDHPDAGGEQPEPTGWIPLEGALFRDGAFDVAPFPDFDDRECRDAEWSLRACAARPDALIRVPLARVDAPAKEQVEVASSIVARAPRARRLYAHAQLFRERGVVMPGPLMALMPELADIDGELDEPRARLLLEVVAARGATWTLAEWLSGELDPLLGDERRRWLEARNQNLLAIERGGWWRLRTKLAPLRRMFGRGD